MNYRYFDMRSLCIRSASVGRFGAQYFRVEGPGFRVAFQGSGFEVGSREPAWSPHAEL